MIATHGALFGRQQSKACPIFGISAMLIVYAMFHYDYYNNYSFAFHSLSRNHWKQSSSFPPSDCTLNVLVLGAEQLASDIINEICLNCGDDGEYIFDGQPYYLHTRIINGSDPETFKNIDFHTSGLICVYSNQHTVEYLKDNLERSLLFNLEMEEKFECIPLVLVYQPEDQKDDNEIEILRSEGQHLAEM